MVVQNVKAIALGYDERPAGVFNGNPYDEYCKVGFVIEGEPLSRTFSLSNPTYSDKKKLKDAFSEWGAKVVINGDLNAKGYLTVTDVRKEGVGIEEGI